MMPQNKKIDTPLDELFVHHEIHLTDRQSRWLEHLLNRTLQHDLHNPDAIRLTIRILESLQRSSRYVIKQGQRIYIAPIIKVKL